VKNNAIDPSYKPFEVMEKISVSILTAQELIISMVYLFAAVRILRIGESVQRKGNRRRIWLLVAANVAIIAIDICTITLEFMALWGVWCSFKGFGYSVKLKIEFAILNQLRDSVKGDKTTGQSYDLENSAKPGISLRSRTVKTGNSGSKPGRMSLKRQEFEQIAELGHIQKRTEIDVRHEPQPNKPVDEYHGRNGAKTPSESSSEIEFANKGT
jgi:hypothetical protein